MSNANCINYDIIMISLHRGYKLLQEAAAMGNTKAQEHLAYGYLVSRLINVQVIR